MLAAAGAALLVHWLSVRIVPHVPVPGRARGFVRTFVASTTGPSRLAVVLGAVWASLPWVSFPAEASYSIGRTLTVGLVVLAGWSAARAIGIAATLYLQRFRIDVDDNLLARKHVTQVRILKRAGDVLIGLVTTATALMTWIPCGPTASACSPRRGLQTL